MGQIFGGMNPDPVKNGNAGEKITKHCCKFKHPELAITGHYWRPRHGTMARTTRYNKCNFRVPVFKFGQPSSDDEGATHLHV